MTFGNRFHLGSHDRFDRFSVIAIDGHLQPRFDNGLRHFSHFAFEG